MMRELCLSLLIAAACGAQERSLPALDAVPMVELHRYAGTWYEIARLPNWFQRQCAGDVTATYTLLEDGRGACQARACERTGREAESAICAEAPLVSPLCLGRLLDP
jgi:apolipoprotein D and lipocalin family protein